MTGFKSHLRRKEPEVVQARPVEPVAEIGEAHRLSDVLTGLLRAFVHARGAMDSASSDLAKEYWADPVLRSLPLPAFTIPQVTVKLKIAVADLGSSGESEGSAAGDMRVVVGWPELERIPAHLISELEFSLTPQAVAGFEHDEEGISPVREPERHRA